VSWLKEDAAFRENKWFKPALQVYLNAQAMSFSIYESLIREKMAMFTGFLRKIMIGYLNDFKVIMG
jgi:hypothetical protein